MKKTLLVTIICVMTAAGAAFGNTQSVVFDDLGTGGGTAVSGTYNSSDTFSFDVTLTFAGYANGSTGFSMWMETVNALAPFLSVTGVTYGTTFPDANNLTPNPAFFTNTTDASAGNSTENRDLGSTESTGAIANGTYFVAHITFTLSGAPTGTFIVRSTTTPAHVSEVTEDVVFTDNPFAAVNYTVTIVPEPSTFALLGMAATGLGLAAYRRRRAA